MGFYKRNRFFGNNRDPCRMMPDVFRCFTVAFRCSQLFSNVLRILLIDYRCSIDIPRCVQDVFRCSKTFKDVFRWSQMFLNLLQMFSRCSLDVQREGDIFEKMHFQFSFYRPQDQESMGCNVYFQNFLFLKWSIAYVCWINHCHETQDQILWSQLAQLLNYQMTSTSFLCTEEYTVRRGQSCQFSFWLMKITKLQGWEKVFSYLPSFGPNRQTQNNQF